MGRSVWPSEFDRLAKSQKRSHDLKLLCLLAIQNCESNTYVKVIFNTLKTAEMDVKIKHKNEKNQEKLTELIQFKFMQLLHERGQAQDGGMAKLLEALGD